MTGRGGCRAEPCVYIYNVYIYIYICVCVSQYLDILCVLYIYICPICPLDLDKSWYMIYHIDTEKRLNRLNLSNHNPLPLPQKLLNLNPKEWNYETWCGFWSFFGESGGIQLPIETLGSAQKKKNHQPPLSHRSPFLAMSKDSTQSFTSKNVRYAVCMAT